MSDRKLDLNDGGPPIPITEVGFNALMIGQPSIEEIFEKKRSNYWEILTDAYTSNGVNEIIAMRGLLEEKLENIKSDYTAISERSDSGVKYLAALKRTSNMLEYKLDQIEVFLVSNVLHDHLKILKDQAEDEQSLLEDAIDSVAVAITNSKKSNTHKETVSNYLKGYYFFKDTSLGLIKIRDYVVENSKSKKVKNELKDISNSTLDYWKRKLETKIDQLDRDSFLLEQQKKEK